MTGLKQLMERHHFLLRRLHSLSGIVPIGVFLIVHLTTNASVVWGSVSGKSGAEVFQHEVNFIHSLPGLLLVEIFGLWLPIAFHSILGVYYAMTGSVNTQNYSYQGNWRYTLQRVSGYVGVFFLFYHIATLRWGWDWLPFASTFNAEHAAYSTAVALKGGVEEIGFGAVVVGFVYLAGMSLLVFHFANGLWTAGITWGLTISAGAQRRWGYLCAGLGTGLMVLGWMAVFGFMAIDLDEIRPPSGEVAASPLVESEGH